jgi:hypothetical protein
VISLEAYMTLQVTHKHENILHERRFRFCLHLASAEKIRSKQNNDHIKEDEHTKILH